jgi:uncharacterized RDD family membrane protein YckC
MRVSVLRQLAVFCYETLLMLALLGFATLPFVLLTGDATHGIYRHLLQVYLWLIASIYFISCWYRSGQTLAMKTWRVRLMRLDGGQLDMKTSLQRYALASFSLLFFGVGFLWALVDREHCSLHDRLLGCRLVYEPKNG